MKEDWMMLKLDAERGVMMKCVQISRLIVICVYIMLLFTLVIMTISHHYGILFRHLTNLTDRNKPLILPTYYCYDTDKSPQFELTYLSQIIGMFLSIVMYTSVDNFLGLVIFHVYGQLENFKDQLISLNTRHEFKKVFRYNVKTHIRLIRCEF